MTPLITSLMWAATANLHRIGSRNLNNGKARRKGQKAKKRLFNVKTKETDLSFPKTLPNSCQKTVVVRSRRKGHIFRIMTTTTTTTMTALLSLMKTNLVDQEKGFVFLAQAAVAAVFPRLPVTRTRFHQMKTPFTHPRRQCHQAHPHLPLQAAVMDNVIAAIVVYSIGNTNVSMLTNAAIVLTLTPCQESLFCGVIWKCNKNWGHILRFTHWPIQPQPVRAACRHPFLFIYFLPPPLLTFRYYICYFSCSSLRDPIEKTFKNVPPRRHGLGAMARRIIAPIPAWRPRL